MTFTLTEECVFCLKQRAVYSGTSYQSGAKPVECWKTLLSVFEIREGHEPRVGGGTVVTVCRECRANHTVEELIRKAREVW